MQVTGIAIQPPTAEFPVEAIDKARGLLSGARVLVKGMRATGSTGEAVAARRDVLAAVRLLGTATNVSVPFSRQMSEATNHALDAALSLGKVIDVLKHVDNGLGQKFAFDALKRADASLDRAYRWSMAGTHE